MNRLLIGFAVSAALVGCSDFDADVELHTHAQPLAHSGPWEPPSEILEVADGYSIANVQAGPWVGTSGCGGSFLEGTRVLREWLYANWPQVTHVGGYACRPINGNSNSMSVHATGRAIDIHIPTDDTQSTRESADNDLGDPLANWLIEHAEEIGIQAIIWDNWIWSTSRSPRSRPYSGAHAHHDHLHVELNPDGAAMRTPWFNGPMDPPNFGPCGEPIVGEAVVDDGDACFQAFGPSQYWRKVDGQGEGGSLRWTNAFKSDDPSNWARWRLSFEDAGEYRVEFNSVSEFAVYDSAQYRIRHGEVEDDVFVDLSAASDGWNELGVFEFAAGEDQWVAIYDNAALEIGDDQHIIADAIRLTRTDLIDDGEDDIDEERTEPEYVDDDGFDFEEEEELIEPQRPRVVQGTGGCATTSPNGGIWHGLVLMMLVLGRRRRR